ncbi:MAG: sulfatase-like hydrolase/transferase, partial [Anaerolineae bacterium]
MAEVNHLKTPNLVFIFADQLRAASLGYTGNRVVHTPNLDRLASESVVFSSAVCGCPVCTPYRACMLTGRYPLSHGVFVNDVRLPENEITFGELYSAAGYDTAYIGKWHLDGPERSAFTPPGPRRHGFKFWAVGNCTHNYFHSLYYRDDPQPLYWDGYDAHAQARLACDYIGHHGRGTP